jgi:hypothetical protein
MCKAVLVFTILLFFDASCSAQEIKEYLHEDANINNGPSEEFIDKTGQRPITPEEAALFAVRELQKMNVEDIIICEVYWIAAPLGGYLVDSKGKACINGKLYTIFHVGIRDGSDLIDGKYLAGEKFVFIASGKDESGRYWYPAPGPDYNLVERDSITTDGMLQYEFLLYRENFENLENRYP